MRKESAAKEKEQKDAVRALEQIEALDADWEYDSSSGYYYNQNNGLCYDSKSGFYYSDDIGPVADSKSVAKSKNETAPGPVLSATLNPMRSVKGAQPSLAVKRKRQDEKKPKAVSKEEAAALKAREAAKKKVEEREKPLLGLIQEKQNVIDGVDDTTLAVYYIAM
ncbi:Detected protein of unknown function [Hibiscus syriacus]|uniref:OCRE domain-containing protein n=1 Tax=Hibiscus syriacus TaxID=106335 RepID=A0A6A3BMP8_HIBSY|nr:Detected protein of unknown function [Hibiscus syriacus]